MSDLEEVKKAVEGIGTAFEEFKKTNDDRLDALAKGKTPDPLLEQKLEKLNTQLDGFEALKVKFEKSLNDTSALTTQLEALEKKLNRPGFAKEEAKMVERAAFDTFCRKGKEGCTGDEIKVLRVGDDTAGGYLAPTEYVREIIKAEVEISIMRDLVRVRQTGNRSVQIPKRTGVFAARWVTEIGTRSETEGLSYGLEELPLHEMTAEVYISQQELEDSAFDMEAILREEFSEQFAVAEGLALVSGNGVGKPEGFMFSSAVGTTNSGSASGVTADGFINLYHAIKTAYAKNASWVLNRATLGSARKLKDTTNQYLWQAGLGSGIPNTILGATYREVPDMPNEGSGLKPVAFGDWKRGYILVDRVNMSVLRDPYTRANVGQVKFVARRRIGGHVVLGEAIRTMNCA